MEPTAHHYAVTVADLERALEFYRDTLGLDVLAQFTIDDDAFATGVAVPGASGRFAHLDAGGARVELVEYDPQGDPIPETALNQPGATHLGLAVEDPWAVYDALPADVPTLSEPQTTGTGTTILFVRDPDGNLVELLDA
jgi:catechol 2,3-dioxygenase-like lactoylglutathione lyase family enzyme